MENEPTKLEFVDSAEALQESLAADTGVQPETTQQETPQQEDTPYVDPEAQPANVDTQEPVQTSDDAQYSDQEVEQAVYSFLSERLGRDVSSLDDLNTQSAIDERVQAIADFVSDTGRNPRDWFTYQQLNPSEMDDATAVRINAAAQYPDLSNEELNLLVGSKYKLDPDLHSEEEVRLSQLQLKMDAATAKREIEELRSQYSAPEANSNAAESFVDDDWINTMSSEVDALEGLEFELGEGKSFTFGLDDNYRTQLKNSNTQIESYFDNYIQEDGNWDFDKFNSHKAVVDNIDSIVANAYKQGLGDGQKGLVNKAANVSMNTAQRAPQGNENSVASQLKNIMSGRGTTTFKL